MMSGLWTLAGLAKHKSFRTTPPEITVPARRNSELPINYFDSRFALYYHVIHAEIAFIGFAFHYQLSLWDSRSQFAISERQDSRVEELVRACNWLGRRTSTVSGKRRFDSARSWSGLTIDGRIFFQSKTRCRTRKVSKLKASSFESCNSQNLTAMNLQPSSRTSNSKAE